MVGHRGGTSRDPEASLYVAKNFDGVPVAEALIADPERGVRL